MSKNMKAEVQALAKEMREYICGWVKKAMGHSSITSRSSRADGWFAFPGGGEVVGGFEPTEVIAWRPYTGEEEDGCAFLFKRLGSGVEYSKSIHYLTTDELVDIYNYLKGGVYNIGFQEWL